jgi:type I restriction enzyme, S subunit
MINPHTCAYETRPLVELCEINIGKTPARANSEYWGVGSPWLSIRDMNQGRIISETSEMITESAINECGCKEVPANTVLMSFKLSIGKVGITKVPLYTNEAIVALPILDPSILDLGFLYHTLKNFDFEKAGGNRAVMGITLNKKSLSTLQIPLPPLSEQKRIAEILDCADAIRRTRQETLKTCDELLRSTFLEMFGDPVTNPMGWEVRELGEVLAVPMQNGAYFEKDTYSQDEQGIEMVHMSDAFYGSVVRGGLKRVSLQVSDVDRYLLNDTDILLARRSLNYEGAAKPCLIPKGHEPLIFESSLIRLRVDQKRLNHIYLYGYLSNERARSKYVYPNVTRSTISGINQAGASRINILVPDLSVQEKYTEVVQKISDVKRVTTNTIFHEDTLFNSLVQRAFRGEL